MKNQLIKHLKLSVLVLPLVFLLVSSCHNSNQNGVPSSYPFYYSSSSFPSYNSGALTFVIQPYGYNTAYEFYEVNVQGVGIYYIPTGGGRITIPYLYQGYYNFTVHVGCVNAYNSNCYQQYINGSANVYIGTQTQVLFQPN